MTVTADVDPAVISGGQVNDILVNSILADLTVANPDLNYTLGGEQQQQLEALDSLYRGFAIALGLIFILLAVPLRSYSQPLIVMAVIPFGLIGLILGHLVLGIAVSAQSFMGFFGLSGVVVNDSLIMTHLMNRKLREGVPARTAIIEGAKGRFRPIMLTSLTTFLGFAPLVFEDAVQAQFLVPFAASLGFGILFTTAVVMMLVPALAAIRLRLVSSRGKPAAQHVRHGP